MPPVASFSGSFSSSAAASEPPSRSRAATASRSRRRRTRCRRRRATAGSVMAAWMASPSRSTNGIALTGTPPSGGPGGSGRGGRVPWPCPRCIRVWPRSSGSRAPRGRGAGRRRVPGRSCGPGPRSGPPGGRPRRPGPRCGRSTRRPGRARRCRAAGPPVARRRGAAPSGPAPSGRSRTARPTPAGPCPGTGAGARRPPRTSRPAGRRRPRGRTPAGRSRPAAARPSGRTAPGTRPGRGRRPPAAPRRSPVGHPRDGGRRQPVYATAARAVRRPGPAAAGVPLEELAGALRELALGPGPAEELLEALADVAGDELGGQLVDALVGEALGPELGAGLVGQEPCTLDLGGLGLGDMVGCRRVLLVDVGGARGRVGLAGQVVVGHLDGQGQLTSGGEGSGEPQRGAPVNRGEPTRPGPDRPARRAGTAGGRAGWGRRGRAARR